MFFQSCIICLKGEFLMDEEVVLPVPHLCDYFASLFSFLICLILCSDESNI